MSAQPSPAAPARHAPEPVSVAVLVDPAGKVEYPGSPRLSVAIHVGRAVQMCCRHGSRSYSGLGVHGDIDIIPAWTPTVWEPKDEDTALVLGLDPLLLARIAEETDRYPDCIEVLDRFQIRDPQIEYIGWALKAEMEAGFPSGRILRDSLGTALAACLLRSHSNLPAGGKAVRGGMSGKRLKQVLSFIEDNLSRDLTLFEIAAAAGTSVSHCKALFRQSMGVPIHHYVVLRRVETAAHLLRNSSLPISHIAQETGFAHQSHLARHMRRVLGYSPKEIRELS